jgi:cellulose synthase/poly-beta-1,6-N-acetylglucosamine synthase-like glycosyltransferase
MTACRAIDYVVGQFIFKKAQAIIDYVYVMPGCATTFRTDVLRSLVFYHDTVTEDLDFTFQMHLRGKKIYYEESAIVYTQDPPNLASYIRQMSRWYGGGWQNLRKYWKIIMHRPAAAFVISSIFVDGVIYGFINLLLPFLYPQVFFFYILPIYLFTAFLFSILAAIHNKRIDLLLYFPHFVFIGFVNSYIIIKEFLLEVVIGRKNLIWNKVDRVSL